MIPQWVIEKKRDGHALEEADIRSFIAGYTQGTIPDYQMAALAMAIYFQGLQDAEVTVLTDAMMRSGDLLDTSGLTCPTSDKHSTGGIGDKVSLLLAPLVACCGVAVPMLSGRGLGITGGTLDKLESIPGYRTDLSAKAFLDVVRSVGCAITGQTGSLAPADRKLYALRDVTGTVPSIPLIAASIMSKKLAEGTATLVLDVKCGSGAFMQTEQDARALAACMVRIGSAMGRRMSALITAMDQPLGYTAGNAVEVAETVQALQGQGAPDLMEVTYALGTEMLRLTGIETNPVAARQRLEKQVANGSAFERLKQMVAAQKGDPGVLDHPDRLPAAPVSLPLAATKSGYLASVDAKRIGRAVLQLGAGRTQTTDTIDPRVGLSDICKVGQQIATGDPLLVIHAATQDDITAVQNQLQQAIQIQDQPITPPELILATIHDDEKEAPHHAG